MSGKLSGAVAYSGQKLSFVIVAKPMHGTVSITNASTGAFTCRPASTFQGSDHFNFKVKDGHGVLSTAATESETVGQ